MAKSIVAEGKRVPKSLGRQLSLGWSPPFWRRRTPPGMLQSSLTQGGMCLPVQQLGITMSAHNFTSKQHASTQLLDRSVCHTHSDFSVNLGFTNRHGSSVSGVLFGRSGRGKKIAMDPGLRLRRDDASRRRRRPDNSMAEAAVNGHCNICRCCRQ